MAHKNDEYEDLDSMLQEVKKIMKQKEENRPNEFILELDCDIEDRFGRICPRGLTISVKTDMDYIDWRDPGFQEFLLDRFKEIYGFNLYYDQIDRSLFNVIRVH